MRHPIKLDTDKRGVSGFSKQFKAKVLVYVLSWQKSFICCIAHAWGMPGKDSWFLEVGGGSCCSDSTASSQHSAAAMCSTDDAKQISVLYNHKSYLGLFKSMLYHDFEFRTGHELLEL